MSKKHRFDAVIRSKKNTFLLAEQNNHTMFPLSQQVKDTHFPGVDALSDDNLIYEYHLDFGAVIHLNPTRTVKKYTKCLKNSSGQEKHDAIYNLCTLPASTTDPHYGYACLVIALLARILHMVPQSIISGTPAVFCGPLLQVPPFLQTILMAVNGEDEICGKRFSLLRPSCLQAQRPFPHSVAVSHSLHNYIGGSVELCAGDYRFWIPLWGRAVCIAPGLPTDVQKTILDASFSVIPFHCNNTGKGPAPWDIRFPENSLLVHDSSEIDTMQESLSLVAAIVEKFFRKCAKKPKQGCSLFEDIDAVIPSIHVGKSVIGTLSAESRILAAGLCVFRAFLSYARKKGWISSSEHNTLLSDAQAALFPTGKKPLDSLVIGTWNEPSAFWPFLEGFLRENVIKISTTGTPCSADTVAAIHTLRGAQDALLILPRFLVGAAYRNYCSDHGINADWSDAALFNAVHGWSVGLKRDGDNPEWPHPFYQKDHLPAGQTRIRPPCFGFPIKQLPSNIQDLLFKASGENPAY